MKKETLIAIFLGVLLGLGVAVGISVNTRKKEIQKIKPIESSLPITPTVIVGQSQSDTLEISSPQSGEVVNQKSVKISGKAPKDGLIVVQSPVSVTVRKSEGTNFSVEYPLAPGENVVLVSFYPKGQSGTPIEKELKIYYLVEQ